MRSRSVSISRVRSLPLHHRKKPPGRSVRSRYSEKLCRDSRLWLRHLLSLPIHRVCRHSDRHRRLFVEIAERTVMTFPQVDQQTYLHSFPIEKCQYRRRIIFIFTKLRTGYLSRFAVILSRHWSRPARDISTRCSVVYPNSLTVNSVLPPTSRKVIT